MSRRSGLGRGLAALIPPTPSSEPTEDAEHGDADQRDEDQPETGTPPVVSGEQRPAIAPWTVGEDRPTADGSAGEPSGGAPDGSEGIDTDREGPEPPPSEAAGSEPVASDPVGGGDRSEQGSGQIPAAAATLAEVAPDSIVPNPRQPRDVFDPDELQGLATSLADIGVLQPLVVRPLGDGRYELVAGERRLRAALLAGLPTVPVVVRHTDDANLLKEALVENIHRVQLNPLEEAAAYQQLLEEFDVTQEELANRLGRSRPAISNAIRLLQLPTQVQRRVASGVLSAGHAKVLLAIDDPAQQARLAERIVAEGMSVRATEELVRLRLLDGPPAAPSHRRIATAPGLVELQDDLSDALEARVRISMGARKGKLAIEFASVDDLERIVSVIANGLEGGRTVTPPGRALEGATEAAPRPPDPDGNAAGDG